MKIGDEVCFAEVARDESFGGFPSGKYHVHIGTWKVLSHDENAVTITKEGWFGRSTIRTASLCEIGSMEKVQKEINQRFLGANFRRLVITVDR